MENQVVRQLKFETKRSEFYTLTEDQQQQRRLQRTSREPIWNLKKKVMKLIENLDKKNTKDDERISKLGRKKIKTSRKTAVKKFRYWKRTRQKFWKWINQSTNQSNKTTTTKTHNISESIINLQDHAEWNHIVYRKTDMSCKIHANFRKTKYVFSHLWFPHFIEIHKVLDVYMI